MSGYQCRDCPWSSGLLPGGWAWALLAVHRTVHGDPSPTGYFSKETTMDVVTLYSSLAQHHDVITPQARVVVRLPDGKTYEVESVTPDGEADTLTLNAS